MRNLRSLLLYASRKTGRSLSIPGIAPASGRMAVRHRFLDLKDRIPGPSPVIVDGGAFEGAVIDIFLDLYPSPKIHAFEPIPELAEKLRTKYAGNDLVTIHEKVLGAETGEVSFNVLNDGMSSSVLPPSNITKEYHGSNVEVASTRQLPQVRLDDVLDEDIDILKLDLQGYELKALEGCGELLARTKAVATEIEFVPFYENQPLFGDIDVYLRSHQFRLLNLYELFTQKDGQLTDGDVIYMNDRYAPEQV